MSHQLCNNCDCFASSERVFLPHCQVSSDTHLHEPFEWRRLHFPPHDHHHLVSQLDVGLPAEVTARRALEHEPKV